MGKRSIVIIAGGLAAIALVVLVVALMSNDPDGGGATEGGADGGAGDIPGETSPNGGGAQATNPAGGGGAQSSPGGESTNPMFERIQERIQISPIGSGPVSLNENQVSRAMVPLRYVMRQCVDSNGGFETMIQAIAAAGGSGRPTVGFVVRANGSVDQESIVLDPPPPAPFDGCYRQMLNGARFPAPGGQGARIKLAMGGLGRRPLVPFDAGGAPASAPRTVPRTKL